MTTTAANSLQNLWRFSGKFKFLFSKKIILAESTQFVFRHKVCKRNVIAHRCRTQLNPELDWKIRNENNLSS